MSLILRPQSSKEEAKHRAQAALFEALIRADDRPILFLSSGGSALELLDRLPPKLATSATTVTTLDERWTNDSAGSNFSALLQTPFTQELLKHGAATIDPRPLPDEPLESSARRFETALRDWRAVQEDWVMIATLGIGTDGHTAGIFPLPNDPTHFANLFDDPNRWVVGYDTGKHETVYPKRITTTLTFLQNAVDEAIVYAVGHEKKHILNKMTNSNETSAGLPAIRLTELRRAQLFTDQNLQEI